MKARSRIQSRTVAGFFRYLIGLADTVGMRGILTDNEAGYGHSIILVSSDDKSDLIVVSMMGWLEFCRVGPDARGGACSNLFGVIAFPGNRAEGPRNTRALTFQQHPAICSLIIHQQPQLDPVIV
jgi:hypothetical protein